MKFSGEDLKKFRDALKEAFPAASNGLDLVVSNANIGIDFADYQGTYEYRIQTLLKDATGRNQLTKLLKAAAKEAPENPELAEVAEFVGSYFDFLPRLLPASAKTELGYPEGKLFQNVSFEDVRKWLGELDVLTRVVCRIESPTGYGTGFLIGSDVVLTNDHVASGLDGRSGFWDQPDRATEVKVRFDYVETSKGVASGKEYRLAKEFGILRSPMGRLDFALLKLDSSEGRPGDELVDGKPRGFVTPVAHEFEDYEPILILQHPEAEPMKLAFGSVTQRKQWEPNRVTYTVNTEPGSSGSPCLTQKLEVCALHHYGLERQNRGVLTSSLLAFWNEPENQDQLRAAGLGHLIKKEGGHQGTTGPSIGPPPFDWEPAVGQTIQLLPEQVDSLAAMAAAKWLSIISILAVAVFLALSVSRYWPEAIVSPAPIHPASSPVTNAANSQTSPAKDTSETLKPNGGVNIKVDNNQGNISGGVHINVDTPKTSEIQEMLKSLAEGQLLGRHETALQGADKDLAYQRFKSLFQLWETILDEQLNPGPLESSIGVDTRKLKDVPKEVLQSMKKTVDFVLILIRDAELQDVNLLNAMVKYSHLVQNKAAYGKRLYNVTPSDYIDSMFGPHKMAECETKAKITTEEMIKFMAEAKGDLAKMTDSHYSNWQAASLDFTNLYLLAIMADLKKADGSEYSPQEIEQLNTQFFLDKR
ncbi:trypsin-like peptidase domain-containing protein [Paludisphaera rhizosphaerae]|uniref:trypsin-like peptidase domain-containing protein n=1 Tax=Paludisphaera rhizosphaerae TaxID=2711216 RepID=UPI0013EA0B92|nr:trypsin-like peptidase domain-containing protein [Paludisphaera rhizosphaerae]